jgi:hypothetical protein
MDCRRVRVILKLLFARVTCSILGERYTKLHLSVMETSEPLRSSSLRVRLVHHGRRRSPLDLNWQNAAGEYPLDMFIHCCIIPRYNPNAPRDPSGRPNRPLPPHLRPGIYRPPEEDDEPAAALSSSSTAAGSEPTPCVHGHCRSGFGGNYRLVTGGQLEAVEAEERRLAKVARAAAKRAKRKSKAAPRVDSSAPRHHLPLRPHRRRHRVR